MPAKIKATPQSQFVNGINRLSKSARAGKKFKNGKLRFAKKAPKAKAAAAERKIGKFYAPEDATEKKFNRRTPKTAKLRSSIKQHACVCARQPNRPAGRGPLGVR